MKNFHTHTVRCHHAVGIVSEYVEEAIAKKMTHLGFSDHVPLPDNRWSDVRMDMSELEEYIKEIDDATEKYQQIEIFKGLECEWAPEYINYYKEELLGKYEFQYLVGGAHYMPVHGEWVGCYSAENRKENLIAYTNYLIKSIDSGLFAFIAHPDLFARFYHQWDSEAQSCSKAILEAAADRKAILEINGYGYRKSKITTTDGDRRPYPIDPFWEMAADYNIGVIINSDAHKPQDVNDFGEAYALAERLNLQIEELQIKENIMAKV